MANENRAALETAKAAEAVASDRRDAAWVACTAAKKNFEMRCFEAGRSRAYEAAKAEFARTGFGASPALAAALAAELEVEVAAVELKAAAIALDRARWAADAEAWSLRTGRPVAEHAAWAAAYDARMAAFGVAMAVQNAADAAQYRGPDGEVAYEAAKQFAD